MPNCEAEVVDATPDPGYASGDLEFGVTVDGCERSDVIFTVMLTFTDGKKNELRLNGKSGGKRQFLVRHHIGHPVRTISDAYDVSCKCI